MRKGICIVGIFNLYTYCIMRQLTLEDRRTLYGMKISSKLSEKQMATKLWVHLKTLRRELKRWDLNGKYAPKKAQDLIDEGRRNNAKARTKLLQDNWYREELEKSLEVWVCTPDSIAWRKKLKGEKFVSTKTIYNYIWLHENNLKKKLTYQKRYKKRKSRQWKRPEWYRHISTRSEAANERTEIWHMEIDLVLSKGNKAWLMTLVDRKSRFWLTLHVLNKQSETINQVLIAMLSEKKIQKKLKTITSDNWREFFWLRHLEKQLWFEQFFADPYCSWQRWTNEQYNWQIRKLFPKWTDFDLVAPEDIHNLQTKLNRKPRKCLWYLTPEEVFFGSTTSV